MRRAIKSHALKLAVYLTLIGIEKSSKTERSEQFTGGGFLSYTHLEPLTVFVISATPSQ